MALEKRAAWYRGASAVLAVLGACALPNGPARAEDPPTADVTITVAAPVDRQKIVYACRNAKDAEPVRITVDYLNMPQNNLAIVPVNGEPVVFALTMSVSGSKYVSRTKVWWTRGNRGDLYDEVRGGIGKGTLCEVVRK